jgi:hypothetical protein
MTAFFGAPGRGIRAAFLVESEKRSLIGLSRKRGVKAVGKIERLANQESTGFTSAP